MRIHNFSAGPSVLPLSVLEKAAAEMLTHGHDGMSVMEMSHRSKAYQAIFDKTYERLASLLSLPKDYHILFMQGGATTQFAALPLNLLNGSGKADYVDTGSWSLAAIDEGRKYGDIAVAASSEDSDYTTIPDLKGQWWRPDADYVHLTSNNTIYGTAFDTFPDTGSVPLVADMSSDLLSRPIDVSKFGLIYAGAQKNAGCAGLTLVIVREDLLGMAHKLTPVMLDYKVQMKKGSMYNTPPTYAIYIAGLVYDWLHEQGDLAGIAAVNQKKAALLYNFLDQSTLFHARVEAPHRSLMNIPFMLPDELTEEKFLKEADQRGFANLKGHRSVGGMRASLYNALSFESVTQLVLFMADFEQRHL